MYVVYMGMKLEYGGENVVDWCKSVLWIWDEMWEMGNALETGWAQENAVN